MHKRCSPYLFAVLALCLLFVARSGFAQDTGQAGLVARARQCGVFSGTVDRILSSVSSGSLSEADGQSLLRPLLAACEAQLPLAPFEDKLDEGLSKRVAPALIVRALNRKLDAYTYAGSLLERREGEVDPKVLVVLGEGLSKGVPRADFTAYVAAYAGQPNDAFLTGAEMTSLLGQVGFDYALTRSMLDAGFASKGLTPEWRLFVRLVLVARQRGLTDTAIARGATEILAAGGSLSDVSARLGFTSRDMTGRTNAK